MPAEAVGEAEADAGFDSGRRNARLHMPNFLHFMLIFLEAAEVWPKCFRCGLLVFSHQVDQVDQVDKSVRFLAPPPQRFLLLSGLVAVDVACARLLLSARLEELKNSIAFGQRKMMLIRRAFRESSLRLDRMQGPYCNLPE